MKAKFVMSGESRPVVVLEPESSVEAMLLAAFMRYEANVFTVSTIRDESGLIKSLSFFAAAE